MNKIVQEERTEAGAEKAEQSGASREKTNIRTINKIKELWLEKYGLRCSL